MDHLTSTNAAMDRMVLVNGSTDHIKQCNGTLNYRKSENGSMDHMASKTGSSGFRNGTKDYKTPNFICNNKIHPKDESVDETTLQKRFANQIRTISQDPALSENGSANCMTKLNGSVDDMKIHNGLIITNKSQREVIQTIASQTGQDDPFYVLDLGDVIQKVKVWRELMPRVKIFYAVKCNNDNTFLETLAILGTGFDCASKKEIEQVTSLGVSPSRIIYAHPCKSESDLKYAADVRLPLMTFDSREELEKVKEFYPEAELVLRIRCDASKAAYTFGNKYGASTTAVKGLLKEAKTLRLNVMGVSFHVGSGCQELGVYSRAIAAAKQVFNEAEELGMKLTLLDVGGGFPGKISDGIEGFASAINSALDNYFPTHDYEDLKIIAEPGRYVSTSAFTLATNIRAKKTVEENGKTVKMYYMNDGVYCSFSNHLFEGELFSPTVLKNASDKNTDQSVIWGPTCCSLDILKKEIDLPNLECGDWLYWPDMGAYTLTVASPFNGFSQPTVHVMASPEDWSNLQEILEISHLTGME